MKKKLILISMLLLVSLTLSGCFLPPPPPGYSRGYGYHGYSRGYDYGDHGDWDRDHHGSGRGSRYWR